MHGFFPGFPAIVIHHGYELSVKHCPRHESSKLLWLHDNGTCSFIPATSTSSFVFTTASCISDSQHVTSWSHWVASVSCHVFCNSLPNSPWRSWACRLTLAMMPFSCLSSISVIVSLHSLWATFMSPVSLFSSFWRAASWSCQILTPFVSSSLLAFFNFFLASTYVLFKYFLAGVYVLFEFL